MGLPPLEAAAGVIVVADAAAPIPLRMIPSRTAAGLVIGDSSRGRKRPLEGATSKSIFKLRFNTEAQQVMLDDPASREVVVGPPAMGVTQTIIAPSPLQASASRLQVDEGTGLSEVETLQRRLAESEQKNKDLAAELKLVKKKLDKTPMSNNDLLLEELNQQVLRLTQARA